MTLEDLDWEPLRSSTGATGYAYDAELSDLYIRFEKDGREAVYKYPDTDPSEVHGLRQAGSVGRFIHYFLKDKGQQVR